MNLKKLILEENVGGYDLAFRAMCGVLAIIALANEIVKNSFLRWIVTGIAFMGLYSSILRHCDIYALLGISTAEKK
ncbi:MAG: YgaP family membrane protein [Methanosarcina sp.]